MQKKDIVQQILARHDISTDTMLSVAQEGSYAFAPANLALCKYWGKRNEELNLPMTSSLSISLGNRGTLTRVGYISGGTGDIYIVGGKEIGAKTDFAKRLRSYLDLFRPHSQVFYQIETKNTVPTAAGLASSASGYAALIQALNRLYSWNLPQKELSILARLGSGSACRSLWQGFVEWRRGEEENGMDCYAEPLPYVWPELRIGTVMISPHAKAISSREAMRYTINTSPFYSAWPHQVELDMSALQQALVVKDFISFGMTTECNSLMMHALMQSARPPIIYSKNNTLAAMERVWELRRAGINVFFTQDAGANLQLLFLAEDAANVLAAFPELEIIQPFVALDKEELTLVDRGDREIGTGEKMLVHVEGQLHRAFSVVIWRRYNGKIELLLQQRSGQKYHSANLWSNTCCGHPRPGEDILVAAQRRLHEEMGITVALKEKGTFYYYAPLPLSNLFEHEIDHVFVAELAGDEFIQPNEEEVQKYRWLAIDELMIDLITNPHQYTVWLAQVLKQCEEIWSLTPIGCV